MEPGVHTFAHQVNFPIARDAKSYKTARSFDVVAHMASLSPEIFKGVTPLPSMFIRPADTGFPLKAGYVNQDLRFKFDVAFGEPGVLEGESLIETLHQLANLVDGLLTTFRPLLT